MAYFIGTGGVTIGGGSLGRTEQLPSLKILCVDLCARYSNPAPRSSDCPLCAERRSSAALSARISQRLSYSPVSHVFLLDAPAPAYTPARGRSYVGDYSTYGSMFAAYSSNRTHEQLRRRIPDACFPCTPDTARQLL